MKKLILPALLAISSAASITTSSAEEWILKSRDFKGKGGDLAKISEEKPKLQISATLNSTHLILNFSNGKQKFGSPAIKIQSGENVFRGSRLL